MNIKAILVLAISLSLLSACVVHPSHKTAKAHHKKIQVKTVLRLEQEHQGHNIVIVNKLPEKKRNCWSHKSHWHCNH